MRKVENRPSVEELKKMLEETSFRAVGRKYGAQKAFTVIEVGGTNSL